MDPIFFVKVLSVEEMEEKFKAEPGNIIEVGPTFVYEMWKYCGRTGQIAESHWNHKDWFQIKFNGDTHNTNWWFSYEFVHCVGAENAYELRLADDVPKELRDAINKYYTCPFYMVDGEVMYAGDKDIKVLSGVFDKLFVRKETSDERDSLDEIC